MKTGPTATHLSHKLLLLVVLSVSPLLAKPGNGNGNGNGNIAPPTPTIAQLLYLTPGTTTDLAIGGNVTGNEAYEATQGNKSISGSFANPDITINSITVNSGTSLTLNITVAAESTDSTFGASTLTITNPNNTSATSTGPIVHITDVPVINATAFDPEAASVTEDIEAIVTDLTNKDGLQVSYSYQWFEGSIAIDGQSGPLLPASITQADSAYRCEITPSKLNGSVVGATVTTSPMTVTADKDDNGFHDQWEAETYPGPEEMVDAQADDDGDGLNNRAEYLFGLDPKDANSNAPIVKPLCPQTCTLEYSRAAQRVNGISYVVQTSTNLKDWETQGGATQTPISSNGSREVVSVDLGQELIDANAHLFVRVVAN